MKTIIDEIVEWVFVYTLIVCAVCMTIGMVGLGVALYHALVN